MPPAVSRRPADSSCIFRRSEQRETPPGEFTRTYPPDRIGTLSSAPVDHLIGPSRPQSPYQAVSRCRTTYRHSAGAMITTCLSSGRSSPASRENEGQRRPRRPLCHATVTASATNMRVDHGVEKALHQLISTAFICILVTSSLADAEYDGTDYKCSSLQSYLCSYYEEEEKKDRMNSKVLCLGNAFPFCNKSVSN